MSETANTPVNQADDSLGAVIAVEHIRELTFTAHKRTYECVAPLSVELDGGVALDKLPEAGHWRLRVRGEMENRDATGAVATSAKCEVEAVIVLRNFRTPQQVREIMVYHFAGQLLGTVRARLQVVTNMTGFPVFTFPVLTRDEIERFAKDVNPTEV